MKTPIRYAGGKSKAYKIITEYIPKLPYPHRIVSPFIGGGSLESKWSSELGIDVLDSTSLMHWSTSGRFCWTLLMSWQTNFRS